MESEEMNRSNSSRLQFQYFGLILGSIGAITFVVCALLARKGSVQYGIYAIDAAAWMFSLMLLISLGFIIYDKFKSRFCNGMQRFQANDSTTTWEIHDTSLQLRHVDSNETTSTSASPDNSISAEIGRLQGQGKLKAVITRLMRMNRSLSGIENPIEVDDEEDTSRTSSIIFSVPPAEGRNVEINTAKPQVKFHNVGQNCKQNIEGHFASKIECAASDGRLIKAKLRDGRVFQLVQVNSNNGEKTKYQIDGNIAEQDKDNSEGNPEANKENISRIVYELVQVDPSLHHLIPNNKHGEVSMERGLTTTNDYTYAFLESTDNQNGVGVKLNQPLFNRMPNIADSQTEVRDKLNQSQSNGISNLADVYDDQTTYEETIPKTIHITETSSYDSSAICGLALKRGASLPLNQADILARKTNVTPQITITSAENEDSEYGYKRVISKHMSVPNDTEIAKSAKPLNRPLTISSTEYDGTGHRIDGQTFCTDYCGNRGPAEHGILHGLIREKLRRSAILRQRNSDRLKNAGKGIENPTPVTDDEVDEVE